MSSNCNHKTCQGETCRRPTEKRPRKPIKRYSAKPKKKTEGQDEWFLNRSKEMTGICCNCGGASSARSGIYWKWSICHIFPKEPQFGFPSVATHPDNWIELCISCHTLFDRSLHVAHTMNCWEKAVDKFKLFENEIMETNRKYYSLFKSYIK